MAGRYAAAGLQHKEAEWCEKAAHCSGRGKDRYGRAPGAAHYSGGEMIHGDGAPGAAQNSGVALSGAGRTPLDWERNPYGARVRRKGGRELRREEKRRG